MAAFLISFVFICIFFLTYAWFAFCTGNDETAPAIPHFLRRPETVLLTMSFIGCLAAWFITPDQYDAIFPVSAMPMLCAFASAVILQLFQTRFSSNKTVFLAILVLCGLNILLLPAGFSLTDGLIPAWSERLALILAWALFAFLYDDMNSSDGVLSLQSLTLNIGMILLYVIGLLPALYGFYSVSFAAVLLAFNFFSAYPSKITLNTAACRMLGFLLGWIAMLAVIEGDGSCAVIICMYYIYETVIAFFKKMTFKSQFKSLSSNTFYNRLAAAGVPPRSICELIARINMMLMLLAGFQLYAPNAYTIILIAFFMVFWLTSRVTSPDESSRHILLMGSLWSFLRKNGKNKEN